jgi:hypothetical protein
MFYIFNNKTNFSAKSTWINNIFYDYLFYIKNKTPLYGRDFVKKSDFEIAISPEGMVNLNLNSKINNHFCQSNYPYFGMG